MEALMTWMASIQEQSGLWLSAGALILGFLLLNGALASLFFGVLRRLAPGVSQETWDSLVLAFRKPLRLFIFLLGLYWGLEVLPLQGATDLQLARYLRVGFIVAAAYGAYHMEGVLEALFRRAGSRMNLQSSLLLRQFSLKVIRFCVAVIALALVAEQFGINAGSIVAGLGLAGLAVAMAAQDTLANIFAGIVLIMDKPFDVGELIEVSPHTGTVENINFRSTRIRLLTQELVTIPNSAIAKGPIINFTRRNQRKVELRLELGRGIGRLKLEELCGTLEVLLKDLEGADPESVLVKVDSVAVTGPVLLLVFLTNTGVWEEYMAIRQEAMLRLMELIDREAVPVARPAQTVRIEQEPAQ